jgi:hypothetical protein
MPCWPAFNAPLTLSGGDAPRYPRAFACRKKLFQTARLLGNDAATFFRFRGASIYRFARLTSSAMQHELLTPID